MKEKTKQITSELTFIGIKETKIAKIDKEETHYKIKKQSLLVKLSTV